MVHGIFFCCFHLQKRITLKMKSDAVLGKGSFGEVYFGQIVETGEAVAVKVVLQDRRFKNREEQVIQMPH